LARVDERKSDSLDRPRKTYRCYKWSYKWCRIHDRPVTYYPRIPLFPPHPQPQTHNVSGLLQPFAFGGETPESALPVDASEALLQLPSPARPFSLGRAVGACFPYALEMLTYWSSLRRFVGASSFFPADVLADFSRELAASLGFVHPFWPPAGRAPAKEFMLGDGGLCENTLVTSLLRRKVKRIVWFANPSKPLQHTNGWDPHTTPPRLDDIDDSFPSFFGLFIQPPGNIGWTCEYSTTLLTSDQFRILKPVQPCHTWLSIK
jgi:hypothetical protein